MRLDDRYGAPCSAPEVEGSVPSPLSVPRSGPLLGSLPAQGVAAARAPFEALVGLDALRARTPGDPSVVVGVIDGPVPPEVLTRWAAPGVLRIGPAGAESCAHALDHGSLVTLMLGASESAPLPGLCWGCTLVVRPTLACRLDGDRTFLHATESEIAQAIHDCLDQGASIINLSLGLRGVFSSSAVLQAALLRAQSLQAVLVWAAGNHPEARGPRSPLPSVLVPVAACDVRGELAPFSNLSPSMAKSGLLAPGKAIPVLRADGSVSVLSGTSLAAPFVTAALALLRSLDPSQSATQVLRSLRPLPRSPVRRSLIPPPLRIQAVLDERPASTLRKEFTVMAVPETPSQSSAEPQAHNSPPGASPQGCGCGGEASATVDAGAPVYAIGNVEARYPTLGIEKEVAQVIARDGLTGTDGRVLYEVLRKPFNKYLARRICWVFRVEGFDTYLLKPEDPSLGFDMLVEAIKPSKKNQDLDLVIGNRTGMAPPSMCNGAVLPIVTFDQLYSFEQDHFLNMIRADDKKKTQDERESDNALLQHILQLADNTGAEDEHRALNYLTVRYARMYQRVSDRQHHGFQLAGISVKPSRISNSRKIVQVVYEFRNRQTDVIEKEYVRVDITEKYPFLVSPMQPYYDR